MGHESDSSCNRMEATVGYSNGQLALPNVAERFLATLSVRPHRRRWVGHRRKVKAVPLPAVTLLDEPVETVEQRAWRTRFDDPVRIARALELSADDPDNAELHALLKPYLLRATKPWGNL